MLYFLQILIQVPLSCMCDVIRMDVIRSQTDSDESSAALETSVVGAVGTGATGGGGGG